MKNDKKNWMANKLSDLPNTDRKASYALQQKNCTDTEKMLGSFELKIWERGKY
jgi:hypothetical protein